MRSVEEARRPTPVVVAAKRRGASPSRRAEPPPLLLCNMRGFGAVSSSLFVKIEFVRRIRVGRAVLGLALCNHEDRSSSPPPPTAGGDAKARAAERRSALRALARLAVTAPHDIERELKAIGHRCGVVLPHPDAELRPPPDARDDFADALPPIR